MMRSREQRCIPLELLDRRDWPLYSFSQRFLTPLCASSARLMAPMMVLLAEEEGFSDMAADQPMARGDRSHFGNSIVS